MVKPRLTCQRRQANPRPRPKGEGHPNPGLHKLKATWLPSWTKVIPQKNPGCRQHIMKQAEWLHKLPSVVLLQLFYIPKHAQKHHHVSCMCGRSGRVCQDQLLGHWIQSCLSSHLGTSTPITTLCMEKFR